ncbi:HIT-like protein [Suillus clintonianus]|uniref:HIT-like protein n=1 Tax=Suillus clintonianus TaxID=1904413 RepID=UPI001B877D90|nr:HIT-like protein [Suillus clintonianus]KAG2132984.1 HIT-like protein [Suillus clintonianus]
MLQGLFHWIIGKPQTSRNSSVVCTFCGAYSTNRSGFDIVWEDEEFLAFRDIRPSAQHHIQLIPKTHIESIRKLTEKDVNMLRRMEEIGHSILDTFNVPEPKRKMGFHIPPFNSEHHLHLHVQALPYTSLARRLKYPFARGFGGYEKGFSWFAEIGQAIRILENGHRVAIAPC